MNNKDRENLQLALVNEIEGDEFFKISRFKKSYKKYRQSLGFKKIVYGNQPNEYYREILFKLGDVCLKLENLKEALSYYNEYSQTGVDPKSDMIRFGKIYYIEFISSFFENNLTGMLKVFAKYKSNLHDHIEIKTFPGETTLEFFLNNLELLSYFMGLNNPKCKAFLNAFKFLRNFLLAEDPETRKSLGHINEFFDGLLRRFIKHLYKLTKQGFEANISNFFKKSLKDFQIFLDSINRSNSNLISQSISNYILYNIEFLKNSRKLHKLTKEIASFKDFLIETVSVDDLEMISKLSVFYMRSKMYDLSLEYIKLYINYAKHKENINYQELMSQYVLAGKIHVKKDRYAEANEFFKLAKGTKCYNSNSDILSDYYLEKQKMHNGTSNTSKVFKILNKLLKLPYKKYHDRKIYKRFFLVYGRIGDEEQKNKYYEIYRNFPKPVFNNFSSVDKKNDILKLFDFSKSKLEVLRSSNPKKDDDGIKITLQTTLFKEHIADNKHFIVKHFKIYSKKMLNKVLKEFRLTRKFSKRRNLFVKLCGFFHRRYKDHDEVALRLESCKSTLEEYFENPENKTESNIINTIKNLVEGFLIMKQSRFVHGDVSPSNILIDKKGNVKIADFGSAYKVENADRKIENHVKEGTEDFMSPEVYFCYREGSSNFIKHDPFKSDVFSLGLSLLKSLGGDIKDLNDFVSGLNSRDLEIAKRIAKKGLVDATCESQEEKERFEEISKKLEKKILARIESIPLTEDIKRTLRQMLKVKNEERPSFDKLSVDLESL